MGNVVLTMKRSKTDTRMFIDIYSPKDEGKKWKKTDKHRDEWWV